MKSAGSTMDPPRSTKDDTRLREGDLLSALPAKSANREVKVGAFVLLGVVAFLTALFTLTDVGTFRGRYYIQTIIESAGGMRAGDPVQMRGVNIGRVTGFDMVRDGVAVTMEIYNRYEVPEDSRIAIRSAGILGGVVVSVLPGESDERADIDDIIPGTVEADMMSAAGGLSTQAEAVLGRAGELLSQQNVGAVGTSVSELQNLILQLSALAAQQRQELAQLTASLQRSAAGVENATSGPELAAAVENVEALTARLDDASQNLSSASTSLDAVLGRIERGEGTLGRLTVDASLYDNLNATALSLQELIADIRQDPRRYLNVSVF